MLFDPDGPSNPFFKGVLTALGLYAALIIIIYVLFKIGSP